MTPHPLTTRLQQELADGLPNLAGAQLKGRIPLRQPLLDVLVQTMLPTIQQQVGMLRALQVLVAGDRQLIATVRLDLGFISPQVNVPITLPATLADDTLIITLSGLGVLAGSVGSLLGDLPPGVRFTGAEVHINLPQLLAAQGLTSLAVTDLTFESTPGLMWVTFAAEVRDAAGTA